MATRLYGVASAAAPVSPGFDAGWSSTSGAVRRKLSTSKSAATETRAGVAVTSGAGNETLGFQLISEPLDGAQSVSGTVSIAVRWRELATSDNIQARVRKVYVVSNDGSTVRGTCLALGNHSVTTEPTVTTLAGFPFANATAITTVSALDGDRIVVELGLGMTTTGTTPQYDMVIGGSGTDHTLAEQNTAGTVPWVEFSANLVFQPVRYAETGWQQGGGSNAAVSVGPVDWQAGDYVVCMGATGDGSKSLGTPAAIGGQSFAAQGSAIGSAGTSAWAHRWVAGPMPSASSGSTSITPAGTATPNWGAFIETLASTGPLATAAPAPSGSKTASLTRTGTGSTVYGLLADWSAGTITGRTYTPAGATEKSSSDGGGSTYSTFAARWDSQGGAGTTSYGLTAGGGAGPISIVLLEMGVTGGPANVALAPATLTLSAQPVIPTPIVALAPAVLTLSAQPTTPTGSGSVALAPATLTLAGQPLVPTPTVALSPAVLSLQAQPVTARPMVALTPAVLTLAAAAVGPARIVALQTAVLTPAAQPVVARPTVALSAAALTLAGQPLTPAAQPVTVALAPAVLTLTGQPTTPTPQPVTAALTPATLTLTGQPLSPTSSGFVVLGPAILTLAGQPVTPRPTIALAPATLALTGRPLTASPAVALAAAAITLTGRPLTTAAQPVTVALAAAVLTFTGRPLQPFGVGTVSLTTAVLTLTGWPLTPGAIPVPGVFGRLSAVAGPQNALTAVSGAAPTHTLAAGTLATVSSRAGRAGGPV